MGCCGPDRSDIFIHTGIVTRMCEFVYLFFLLSKLLFEGLNLFGILILMRLCNLFSELTILLIEKIVLRLFFSCHRWFCTFPIKLIKKAFHSSRHIKHICKVFNRSIDRINRLVQLRHNISRNKFVSQILHLFTQLRKSLAIRFCLIIEYFSTF